MNLLQGRDWDITDSGDAWRVQPCGGASCTAVHAYIEAQKLGCAVDGQGYLLDAIGRRQPADSAYFPVRVEPGRTMSHERRAPLSAA